MIEEEFYKLKAGDIVEYNGQKFVFDCNYRGQTWLLIEGNFRFIIFKNGNI